MKKSTINKFIIILVSFLIFIYLKDELLATGLRSISTFISNKTIPILLLLLVTLTYNIANFKKVKNHSSLPKTLTVFIIYIYIIALLFSIDNPFPTRNLYGSLLLPLSVFWFFYFITEKDNSTYLITIMSILLLGLGVFYYKVFSTRQFYFARESVNNASYFLMYFLPFMLCLKSKVKRVFSIIIISLVVFSSFKRTGTFAVIFAILTYVYVKYIHTSNKKLLNLTIVSALFLFVINYIIQTDLLSDNYLIARIQSLSEDEGTGRLFIWQTTLNMIKESNLINLILGHGYYQVFYDSPLNFSAHNVFLEVTYDFGLIGLSLLIILHFKLIQYVKQLIKSKSFYAASFAASYAMFLIASLSSHIVVYSYYFLIFTSFWGFVLGITKNNIVQLKKY